jgi:hypothetical protein
MTHSSLITRRIEMLIKEMQISEQSGTIRELPWTMEFATVLAQEAQEVEFSKDEESYLHENWIIRLQWIRHLDDVDLLTFVKPPTLEAGDVVVFPVWSNGRVGHGRVVHAEGRWSPLRGSLFYGNDRTYGHFHA